MFPQVVELVRENDELREEVGSRHNLKFYLDVFPFPLPWAKSHSLLFFKVERRRLEVEGLLRERSEGWRAR